MQNSLEIKNICGILLILLCTYQLPTYRLNNWAQFISGDEYKSYIEDNFYESWTYDSRRYRCATYNENSFSNLKTKIISNPQDYYFLNFSTTIQVLYLADNPFFTNGEEETYQNCSFLYGVTVNFPDILDKLEVNGVDNPLRDLVNENIYLVDNLYQEKILKYLREHYYPDARMELAEEIDGFKIWKFYKY